MSVVTMRQLLEAGAHFGHQTRRWNPKMAPFIFGERNSIHIIDLRKTIEQINRAYDFVRDTVISNGTVLFVGTKRQARDAIREEAERCGMYYVNHRWLGGMLTNHETIKKSIRRLKRLERMEEEGIIAQLPKKEIAVLRKEQAKLERNLCGVKDMAGMPNVVFITDIKGEAIAVRECNILGIPTIGVADTNADPNDVMFPIPGNDDAIRSIRLFISVIADAVVEGLGIAGREVPSVETKQADEPVAEMEAGQAAEYVQATEPVQPVEPEQAAEPVQTVEPEQAGEIESSSVQEDGKEVSLS